MWVWIWQHRKVWKGLKQFWDNRIELKLFLRSIEAALVDDGTLAPSTVKRLREQAKYHHEWLSELDRLPLARAWRIKPPPAPCRKNRPTLRGTELPKPVQGETSPFLDKDGNLKAGLIPPAPSLPGSTHRVVDRQSRRIIKKALTLTAPGRSHPFLDRLEQSLADPPPSKRPENAAHLKWKEARYWNDRIEAFNRGEILWP